MQEKSEKKMTVLRPPQKIPPKNKKPFPHVIEDDVLAKNDLKKK